MNLSIGIVGLPNVGKSTLFNALTKKSVPAENYPFCTIDPSVGIVPVPDERLWKLSEFSKSKKTIPAVVEFVDIAGLVKGASEGEGLGNKFLQNIREVDAIAQVVRIFEDKDIIHVGGRIDPLFDIEIINFELIQADLQTVTKRLSNIQKDVKAGKGTLIPGRGKKEAEFEDELLKRVEAHLKDSKLANTLEMDEKELPVIKQLSLLTMKPIMYVLNTSEATENRRPARPDDTSHSGGDDSYKIPGMYVEVDPVFEKGLDDLIKKGYELLNLITYFTTGEDETRAWTVAKGSTAPVAGMAIHTDFKDKFIRAEVVHNTDLLSSGSYASAREKGLVKTEGKEYVVKDGDIVEFKI